MKNGMHLKASAAPVYQGMAGRPQTEAVAQCERCHAQSSVELATGSFVTVPKVLGFRVYDATEKIVIQAEADWLVLDRQAIESGDIRLTRRADAAKTDLYRLRDKARGDPRYRHQGCGGDIRLFAGTAGAVR